MNEIKPLNEVPQIRIFDYLHQSAKTLKSDSNYMTHKQVYKYLNKHYPHKFYFYLTYDYTEENEKVINKLARDNGNIQPIPIEYFSTNAIFRNALDWKNLSKLSPDIDMVLCNQPEILYELISFFVSKGNYVPAITYSHWYPSLIDDPLYANYLKTQDEKFCVEAKYFFNYMLAHKNYNNSHYGVNQIKHGFRCIPDLGWKDKMLNKLQCLYMTSDHEDIDTYKPEIINKEKDYVTIVFNHRHNAYTGFKFFFECIQKIIKIRPNLKFKIFMTAVGEHERSDKFEIPDEYFLNKESLAFPDYVKQLWNADIEIGAHIGSNQWSIAFLDAMFANLIPFYRKNIFFDEMFEGLNMPGDYSFGSEDEFVEKLIYMIENIQFFRDKNQVIYDHFRKNLTWDTLIHGWANAFMDCYDQTRITTSDKFLPFETADFPMPWNTAKDIMNISDQRNNCTYRKSLKEQYNLKEDMTNPKIVFYKKDQPITKTKGYF